MGWFSIFGLINAISSLFTRILNYFEREQIKKEGKDEVIAEINNKQIAVEREQTKIVMREKTQAEIVDELNKGNF